MRYTKKDFDAEYPNDDVCLDTIFQNRYGNLDCCPSCGVVEAKFYRVSGRKCYACEWCGYQLHPLAQTIFHKSSTPLKDWFFAIYLFSVAKNGVSAKEIERHLGVTYKTAHRMARQIRSLMDEEGKIGGEGRTVEADETYFGKRISEGLGPHVPQKTVLGAVERQGNIRAKAVDRNTGKNVREFITGSVAAGSVFNTDESPLYKWAKTAYNHTTVNHRKLEYVRGSSYTNTIEGFWGQLKRSLDGTYHAVSPKYLQLYLNEFAFRYNYRDVAVYPVLLERVWKRA